MNTKLFNASLLTACVVLASASPVSANGYTFSDLGTLGGINSGATGINDSGQVMGVSIPSYNTATIWNGTTSTYLGKMLGTLFLQPR
jgi:uncharacterized membrane protein